MSVMDDVATLQALAAEVPTASLRQSQQTLTELYAKLVGLLGTDFVEKSMLADVIDTAGIRLESAMSASKALEDAINTVADALMNAGS
jgi:hypothetical protein